MFEKQLGDGPCHVCRIIKVNNLSNLNKEKDSVKCFIEGNVQFYKRKIVSSLLNH